MSEQIVKFIGDSTSRELWEGGTTVSTGLSRKMSPVNRNFSMVAFQQAKPILDSEVNLMQQIQNQLRADALRALLSPGIISMTVETGITDVLNSIRVRNAKAHVNGWLAALYGANRSDTASDIIFTPAPYSGTREDLAFAEFWFEEVAPSGSREDDDEHVYKYGGIKSGTLANDLIDNVAGAETSRRIQLRWNLRTVSDVDFTNYPYGVNHSAKVKAQAGAANETSYSFSARGDGLYRAGDGSTTACSALNCVDGYVYALPLFQVHRRNQTAYSTDNLDGAPAYSTGRVIPNGKFHDVIAAGDVKVLFQKAQPHGAGNWDALGIAIADAETLGQVNWNELEKWKKQRIQQGTVTLYNRFVVKGCVVNAVPGTRNVQITANGTYDKTHFSRFFADGMLRSIEDTQSSVAAVPTNSGTSAKTYYSYLQQNGTDFTVNVGESVPEGAIRLYRISVPAGDTGADLSKVSFASERRVEANYTAVFNTLPSAFVTLPGYTMPDSPDYTVNLEVESAVGGLDTIGALRVTEKGNNGFKIIMNGMADRIKIRWTLINPDA